jgi:hypothetical protein
VLNCGLNCPLWLGAITEASGKKWEKVVEFFIASHEETAFFTQQLRSSVQLKKD